MCKETFFLCHRALLGVHGRVECSSSRFYPYISGLNGRTHPNRTSHPCRCCWNRSRGEFEVCHCATGETRGICVRGTVWEERNVDKPWLSSPDRLLSKEWVWGIP